MFQKTSNPNVETRSKGNTMYCSGSGGSNGFAGAAFRGMAMGSAAAYNFNFNFFKLINYCRFY